MAIEEIRTFLDIQDAILRRGKIEDTTENRTNIKEYTNTIYQQISREEHYTWNGSTMPIRLRGKYATGTLTATNASDEITGASTVWVENDHRFSKMHISGNNHPFKIIRVASTTTATLDAPFVGTTASSLGYTIYRDEYGLFPDCKDVRWMNIPGVIDQLQPRAIGIHKLDLLRTRFPFREGTPRFFTVFGKAIYTEKTWATFNLSTDYWEDTLDTEPRNLALVVWPGIMATDKTALIRYTKTPYPLNLDTDEPWIPVEDRQVLVWGVLSERFVINRDIPIANEWEKRYKECKRKMAGDIEVTDDELTLDVDASSYSRGMPMLSDDEWFFEQ